MNQLFKQAVRNILRNRRRSLATLLAMVLGIVTILLFGGYSQDIKYTLETGYIQRGGHIQIQRKDYFLFGTGNPSEYSIEDYRSVIKKIEQDPVLNPKVAVMTPILQLSGVAGNFSQGVSRTVLATGMDIEGQNKLHEWNYYDTFQTPKKSPLTGTPADASLVGIGVARVLRLCEALKLENCPKPATTDVAPSDLPGDIAALASLEGGKESATDGTRIELLAATAKGAPNVSKLNVVAATPQGVKELDDVYVAMHLEQAQRLVYGKDPPKVTSIILQLNRTADLQSALDRLNELINHGSLASRTNPLEIRDFKEIYPFYNQALAMFRTIFGFIAILIGSIVLFTVGNTMGTAVVERTVEIGTLRAMGMKRSGIKLLFVAEGIVLGVLGALIGVLSALLLSAIINHSGITWIPPGWSNRVPFVVRVWGEWSMVIGIGIGVMIVASLSSWWPARRAAASQIVESLRHV